MKPNRLTLFILLLTMAGLAGCAELGAGPETSPASTPHTITVQGYGASRGDPDMATVNLGANAANTDISMAVQESNQLIADITAALQGLGIAPADIQTTGFTIWPEQIYDPNTGQITGEKRYHVDSSLQIIIRKVTDVGKVLETAINHGSDNVYGLTFGIQDSEGLAATARSDAIADARKRAEEMAQGLGVTLGAVSSASDFSNGPIQPYFAPAEFGMGGGSGQGQPPISQGQMTVSVSVSVSFEILK
jgi:uncharacterized protein YggE